MDWDSLRFVLAVARAGSLSEAAKQLGVSHSTVYRRINAFEDEHKITAFERLPDGYRLTEAGRSITRLAERVEESVNDVARQLTRSPKNDEVSGAVRVAAPEAVALAIGPQLAPLLDRHPALALDWVLGAAPVDLNRREADIAIRVAASPPDNLVGRRLADVAFAVYGASHAVERHGWSYPDRARWVVFDDSQASSPQGRWERANISADSIAIRVNRRVMLDLAVTSGLGLGVLPRGVGDASTQLVRLTDTLAELTLPLWVLTHPDLREVVSIRAVMDFCGEVLGRRRGEIEASGADENEE